ncbi:HNH endonuclease signature motif containing protein [Natronosalvus caseinilyticus]|uniref:HNH endonuclease signature motif containing protein n=1 Tax=Natronosalvus caseinilyticus TaxID=2953747 RepID=UPI003CCDF62E
MAVRARDSACVRCGREETSNGRGLYVHHIIPERKAEDPHDPQNLLSVCDACHQSLEGLPPEEQLQACDIESRDELRLRGEDAAWMEKYWERVATLETAPDPWPGMFAEAQKHFNQCSE